MVCPASGVFVPAPGTKLHKKSLHPFPFFRASLGYRLHLDTRAALQVIILRNFSVK